MGADIAMYLEMYDSHEKKWIYGGVYDAKGRILPLIECRARHFEEALCNTDSVGYLRPPIADVEDQVCPELMEKYKSFFSNDPTEPYSGIYLAGHITVAELQREYLLHPQVRDEDYDPDLPTHEGLNEAWKPNPLKEVYETAEMIGNMVALIISPTKWRVVFFCDN